MDTILFHLIQLLSFLALGQASKIPWSGGLEVDIGGNRSKEQR